jgi:catechol 2,3-dioxygenase-like lactoylglutathione lyase family enzyme
MSMQNVMAALAVSDIQAASAWFTKLLGRGPTQTPMPGLLEWEFPGGGWLQVYQQTEGAGQGSVTIIEDDLETRVASLQTAHIRIDSEKVSDETSIAVIRDPDGNRIVFAMPRV